MIGKHQIQIDAKQITAGMATSDYTNDGGFGTSTSGLNPILTPGVVRALATPTDISTNLKSSIIASCEDSQASSANNRLLVDDAANYYVLSGTTLTKKHTGTATSSYIFGKTDMASFNGNTYITLSDDIAQWNTSSDTLTESWWQSTKSESALDSTVPHPLLVFENILWIGDAGTLRTIDSSGTISSANWSLNSTERVYALGIDPATGLMLVSVQTTVNISDTLSSKFFIYLYDGYSTKPRRKIPVDDLVTAFHNVGGVVYVGMGTRLCYFNGNGVSFLRSLTATAGNNLNLPYRHHISNVGNILLVVDGSYILAYGEITQGGRKVFWYPFKNTDDLTNNCTFVTAVGQTSFAIGYLGVSNTVKLKIADFASTSAGEVDFYTANINFERPVFIRKVRVFTTGVTTTSGVGGVYIFDETAVGHTTATFGAFVNSGSGVVRVFDFDFSGLKLQMAQPRVTMNGQAVGIIRIVVYYDVAE